MTTKADLETQYKINGSELEKLLTGCNIPRDLEDYSLYIDTLTTVCDHMKSTKGKSYSASFKALQQPSTLVTAEPTAVSSAELSAIESMATDGATAAKISEYSDLVAAESVQQIAEAPFIAVDKAADAIKAADLGQQAVQQLYQKIQRGLESPEVQQHLEDKFLAKKRKAQ